MSNPAVCDNTTVCSGNKVSALLQLLRPRQWIKNIFVLAAVIFSKNILSFDMLIKSVYALLLFCGISSCVYVLNDIIDVDYDRNHPQKKLRPLPSGTIEKKHAVYLLIILLIIVVACSCLFNVVFTGIIMAYFCLNLLYSFKLKQIIIIDIVVIALGFVLRAVSGAVVLSVRISPWLLICTLLLALFLGLNKRKSEILMLAKDVSQHRKILSKYSIKMIDVMLTIIIIFTILAYTLYTLIGAKFSNMIITLPFVIFGILRFQHLASRKGMGGSPELALLKDIPLIAGILLWVAACVALEYL